LAKELMHQLLSSPLTTPDIVFYENLFAFMIVLCKTVLHKHKTSIFYPFIKFVDFCISVTVVL